MRWPARGWSVSKSRPEYPIKIRLPMSGAAPQPDPASFVVTERQHAAGLFLAGFLIVFLELACFRWFAAKVVFLQFFTNTVLLASLLGLSCGCMTARHARNWLASFPLIGLCAVGAALALLALYTRWQGQIIDSGHQTSPQEVFFGQYRDPDVTRFPIPIDLIVAAVFVLIAFLFVGLGQVLGRTFAAYPHRLLGYTLNIVGSLGGLIAFSLLSFLQTDPVVWFVLVAAGVAYLLQQTKHLSPVGALLLCGFVLAIALPYVRESTEPGGATAWSPYNAVRYTPWNRSITINNVEHQQIVPFSEGGAFYSLVHVLQHSAGGPPFEDALIIGDGAGNDIEHALRNGVRHIDGVESDPVIQKIGIESNPDSPYVDHRVTRYVTDGRHFLRVADHKYDLVIYAFVDSLILHSSYANLPVENYFFTQEGFDDVKRALKTGGLFVTYSYTRQDWMVERIAAMSERAFGCKPIILSVPYRRTLPASGQPGLTALISGCGSKISDAFARHPDFWLHVAPFRNIGVNGFLVRPDTMLPAERAAWQRISPTSLPSESDGIRGASDDWPFLYLRDRLIPNLSLRLMIELGLIGAVTAWLFLPKEARGLSRFDWRMFFVGAGFMLLESHAVAELAPICGSTWFTDALALSVALILVLLANLFVLRFPRAMLSWHYLALLVLLLAAIAIPTDVFLGSNISREYVVAGALTLGPLFFAGVVFAETFKESRDPDCALGSSLAGALLGGLGETFSMLLGFRHLLLLAVAFIILSMLGRRQLRVSPA